MTKSALPVIIDSEACDGCGRCVTVCTMNVFEIRETERGPRAEVINPADCLFCEACIIDCRRCALMLNPESRSNKIRNISSFITERTAQEKPKKSFFMKFFR